MAFANAIEVVTLFVDDIHEGQSLLFHVLSTPFIYQDAVFLRA